MTVRMRKFTRKKLCWSVGGFALCILLVLGTCSLWWPAILQLLASSYGFHYSAYRREGAGRFELADLRYDHGAVHFQAEELHAFLPPAWFWKTIRSQVEEPFVSVKGWSVTLRGARTDPTNSVTSNTGTSPPKSFSMFSIVRRAQRTTAFIRKWSPHLLFQEGNAQIGSRDIHVPKLQYKGTVLTAELQSRSLGQHVEVRADLPPGRPWQAQVDLPTNHVTAQLSLASGATSVGLNGSVTWRTNQVEMDAQFGSIGWLPQKASLTCSHFRIPADELKLKGYNAVSGEFAASWTNPSFELNASANALPLAAQPLLPPVQATLRARGDTNQLHVSTAEIHSPWLKASLAQETIVHWTGRPLREPAEFRLVADLAKMPWFTAAGKVEGRVNFNPGTGRIPNADLSLSSVEVESAGIKGTNVTLHAQFEWPWLQLSEATLATADGSRSRLQAKANLQTRTVTGGSLQVSGSLGTNLLPAGVSCGAASLDAQFSGPWDAMTHRGHAEVDALALRRTTPWQLQLGWHGTNANLEHFEAMISAKDSTLELAGSSAQAGHQLDLQLARLELSAAHQPRYGLAAPCTIGLSRHQGRNDNQPAWRMTLPTFRWQGTNRLIALSGDLAWPSEGSAAVQIENFDLAQFQDFVQIQLPRLSIVKLDARSGWTNRPVSFELSGLVDYELTTPLAGPPESHPLAVQIAASSTTNGLRLSELVLTHGSIPVLSASGTLPLVLDPNGAPPFARWNPGEQADLHAATASNSAFWHELARGLPVELVEPRVQADVSGPLAELKGKVRASAAAIRPTPRLTNGLPRVEDVRAEIELTGRQAKLQSLELRVEGQPVAVTGQVPIGSDMTTDWRRFFRWAEASGSLTASNAQIAPFAFLAPEQISPEGEISAQIEMRSGFQFDGQVFLHGAGTRPLPSIGPIQDLESRLRLAGRKVQLETFTGLLGGEPFSVTGALDFGRPQPQTGLPELFLTVRGEDLALARQPDLILRSDVDLQISNRTNSQTVISGSVRLRDSVFLSELKELIPGKIAKPRTRPPYFSVEIAPFQDWQLNLQVKGDKFLKIRSPFFRGQISTDLKLEGNLREPRALGDVTVNSGMVDFPFGTLELTQGLVSFTSASPYRPQLYVSAGGRTFGYDVRMEITGTADSPVLQFSSTPPLTSEQVLLMLTAGEIPRSEASVSTQQRAGRLAVFLGKNLLSELVPNAEAAERLSIRSGEYLSDQGQQTYSIEYRLNKRWSLVGEYDRFGAVNAGVKWHLYSR